MNKKVTIKGLLTYCKISIIYSSTHIDIRISGVFKSNQQDAFLPHVEAGVFTFIGATTENPSFSLNNALLSRAHVYTLKALNENDLHTETFARKKRISLRHLR